MEGKVYFSKMENRYDLQPLNKWAQCRSFESITFLHTTRFLFAPVTIKRTKFHQQEPSLQLV